MKIGVREADYVLMHFEEHFRAAIAEDENCKVVSENSLMYIMLISILCTHNSFFPFTVLEEEEDGVMLLNLSWYCVNWMSTRERGADV